MISTADLGGTGNGLGLPIANPLYGPATAAAMGQQAWQENIASEQAQRAQTQALTAQTQSQTQIAQQKAPAEIGLLGAQTQAETAAAKQKQLENEATAVLSPQQRAAGIQSDIFSKQSEAAQRQQDTLHRWIINNAEQLDQLGPQSLNAVANQAKTLGMDPQSTTQMYAGLASNSATPAPAMGPAGAAAQPQAGWAGLKQRLIEANPEIYKSRVETQAAQKRTETEVGGQIKMNDSRIDAELKRQAIDISSDPAKASQFFMNKFTEAKNAGDDQLAAQWATRSMDAYARNGDLQLTRAYAQNFFNPMLQALGITTVGQGANPGGTTGMTPPGGGGTNTVQTPKGPVTYKVIPPGGPTPGTPQTGPNPAALSMPAVPTGPGGPQANPTPQQGGPYNGSWQVPPQVQQNADQQAAQVRVQEAQEATQAGQATSPIQHIQTKASQITALLQTRSAQLNPQQIALLKQELNHLNNAMLLLQRQGQ